VVTQSVTVDYSDISNDTVTESAVAVWAVFNVLDSIPATPETQLTFEQARRRVQQRIAATGVDTDRIDSAFRTTDLPRVGMRGDPPLSC
jgi:hypothetical protein